MMTWREVAACALFGLVAGLTAGIAEAILGHFL